MSVLIFNNQTKPPNVCGKTKTPPQHFIHYITDKELKTEPSLETDEHYCVAQDLSIYQRSVASLATATNRYDGDIAAR